MKQIQQLGKGKLELRGHNISMDKPISVDALDHLGNRIELPLKTLLERLDDFEGCVGKQRVGDNLIDCLFIAYQYNIFTEHERTLFESYAHSNYPGRCN